MPRAHYADPSMDKDYYTDEGLKALSACTEMQDLSLGSVGITEEGVKHLAKLTQVRKLSLFGCSRITDESLRTIGGRRSLEEVHLLQDQLTLAGLNALSGLTNLKRLQADDIGPSSSNLDLSGLVSLESLSLMLRHRYVGGSTVYEPLQERDIAALGKLTRLTRLDLSSAGATNAALRQLTGLKQLERLVIGGDGLTDDGLACLAEFPKLSDVSLGGRFTDRALKHLQKVPNLRILTFSPGTRFTAAAVNDFKRSMPMVILFRGYEIDRGPGPSPAGGGRRR